MNIHHRNTGRLTDANGAEKAWGAGIAGSASVAVYDSASDVAVAALVMSGADTLQAVVSSVVQAAGLGASVEL